MRLQDRLQDLVRTPGRRIAMSMLGFGLGALLVASTITWLAISVAEGLLPASTNASGPRGASSAGGGARPPAGLSSTGRPIGAPKGLAKTAGSKAGPDRGNDSPSAE